MPDAGSAQTVVMRNVNNFLYCFYVQNFVYLYKKKEQIMKYYFAVDTETTGLDADTHQIAELGGILLDDKLNEIARGVMRLNIDWESASQQALNVNGIKKETWKPTHKTNKEAVESLVRFIKKNVPSGIPVGLICHNADFDIKFMKKLFKENDVDWIFDGRYTLDTLQAIQIWSFVKEREPKYISLSYLIKMFDIKNNNEHRAMGDIQATVELLKAIIKSLKCNTQKRIEL